MNVDQLVVGLTEAHPVPQTVLFASEELAAVQSVDHRKTCACNEDTKRKKRQSEWSHPIYFRV
jgi:hypothetical protein